MTAIEQHNSWLANYQRLEQSNGSPSWLVDLRRRAIAEFQSLGFPTTRQEEWRFTNVAPMAKLPFAPAGQADPEQVAALVAQHGFGGEAAAQLVFVNGRFDPGLSRLATDAPRVRVGRLADGLRQADSLARQRITTILPSGKDAFVALNTAMLADGAFVHFARGAAAPGPVHLLFLTTSGDEPAVTYPRVLVLAEDGAHGSIVETYAGAGGDAYLTNAVTEVTVGRDAVIDHYKIQREAELAYHISATQAHLSAGAGYIGHSVTLGGKLTRNDLEVVLDGEHAEATLNGLVVLKGAQHVDNHTLLRHEKPNCPSHELYKYVLDEQANGVFKGKIFVQKDAQKTDAKQNSKSLLLSDAAAMNSMPALEIYADDVKCTHGSTTGPVDEDMVFYLRSRGVSLEAARHLLTYAFAADITRRIKVGVVRRRIEDFMAAQHGLPQDLRITDLGEHNEAAR